MVSQKCRRTFSLPRGGLNERICGVALRGPVLCDANNLPGRFREWHTSMSESFHTSLLSAPALTPADRPVLELPLEAESFEALPRHYIQVCTNDVYYSDGVLYGEALREVGVDVKMDVLTGWPHTFWLKAPELERAREAEKECIEGVRWLLDCAPTREQMRMGKEVEKGPGGFVPMSEQNFERAFNGE